MAAMAGPHGHYYEDDRMIRRSIDSHGWKKGDVESGSKDSSWDFDLACHKMCNRVTYPIRRCAWGANFRGMHGGRYALNFGRMVSQSYTSLTRILRCHEALHLLQELQLRGLLPNVITYKRTR